jgi:hypothetical protein
MAGGEPLAVEQLVPGFVAENDLERALVAERELLQGLARGHPRFGHPEARVGLHVAAILGCLGDYPTLRADLRLIALVHDSFKYEVRSGEPRVARERSRRARPPLRRAVHRRRAGPLRDRTP